MSLAGTTEVKVPIFGGKIEAMISEQVLSLIDNEHDFTGEWIEKTCSRYSLRLWRAA